MFTNTLIALIAALGLASAAPTATTGTGSSKTVTLTGVTHSVVAGRAGLHFDPENVVAEVGDVVEWHFLPKNRKCSSAPLFQPGPLDPERNFIS